MRPANQPAHGRDSSPDVCTLRAAKTHPVPALHCRRGLDAGIGLTFTVLAVRLMTSLLFGVSPIDPTTCAVVAVGLIGAALLACYVPAARAASMNPVDALRAD